ncbi:MAG TPA: hypothetical protein VIC60_06335, partial [Thermomicrobiales bacterium]
GSGQRAASAYQNSEADDQGRKVSTQSSQSSCRPEGTRSPQSFTFIDTARTPNAPGHSLTEG